MTQRVKTDQTEKVELLREGVHKELVDDIQFMIDKLDDRKLNIVYRFIKRLVE